MMPDLAHRWPGWLGGGGREMMARNLMETLTVFFLRVQEIFITLAL
jgi:hypothetical protein